MRAALLLSFLANVTLSLVSLAIQANLLDTIRLNERVFLVAFVSFLGYTVYWTVGLLRAFQIPR